MSRPDASYVSEERLRSLPPGGLRSFPHVCPDFVIELRSESDALEDLQRKMGDWIVNGARLAWLIDPEARRVYAYRPGRAVEMITAQTASGEGPVEGFTLDLQRIWKCYED